jgi:hypothetical protein
MKKESGAIEAFMKSQCRPKDIATKKTELLRHIHQTSNKSKKMTPKMPPQELN